MKVFAINSNNIYHLLAAVSCFSSYNRLFPPFNDAEWNDTCLCLCNFHVSVDAPIYTRKREIQEDTVQILEA